MQTHTRVHDKLRIALETIPQATNNKNAASHALLSSTIEASLLKLSLVRARLCSALYDYSAESDPSHTIAGAVNSMEKKLKLNLQKLDAEEADIKARLKGYDQLMAIVDSKGRGFSQIVKDLAQVKKETEECYRDLRWMDFLRSYSILIVTHRRLGWTET